MMIKKIAILIFFISLLTASQSVFAESEPREALPYKVRLELPENQKEGIKGFYNLSLPKDTEQTLNISLQNISENIIHLNLKSGNALTSTQGGIIYIENRGNEYTALTDEKFYMDQNIVVQEKIELAPYEEKLVSVKVKATEKGTSLGTVLISQDEHDFETIEQKEDVELTAKNRFVFAVPIQINTEEVVAEEFKVLDVTNIIAPNKTFIGLELENPNAAIHEISFKYKVLNKKGEVLFDGEQAPLNAAPKSRVVFHIPWKGTAYETGKYEIVLSSGQLKEDIVRGFAINRNDVKTYAEESGLEVPNPILNMPLLFWVILTLLLTVGLYGSYRLGIKRKDERDKEVA